MNAYLSVAEKVLRRVRRPLTAREILRIGYLEGLAPAHLRGKTQHKTLQARLSEDILRLREASKFCRTAPGRFFLTDLTKDCQTPPEWCQPIVARRRRRELTKTRALAFESEVIDSFGNEAIAPEHIIRMLSQGSFEYANSSRDYSPSQTLVWAFVVVLRAGYVLSYRQGAYREERDSFLLQRSIGFYTPVESTDLSLFDQSDHGIVAGGLKALATDLDLLEHSLLSALKENSSLTSFVAVDDGSDGGSSLLAVIEFRCPEWLEPTSTRLALHDLEWLDLRAPSNNEFDLDPWSRAVLPEARRLSGFALL